MLVHELSGFAVDRKRTRIFLPRAVVDGRSRFDGEVCGGIASCTMALVEANAKSYQLLRGNHPFPYGRSFGLAGESANRSNPPRRDETSISGLAIRSNPELNLFLVVYKDFLPF